MSPRPVPAEERFWSKVDKNGPVSVYQRDLGQCWQWTAGVNQEGAGLFWDGNANVFAHRFSWSLRHGTVPGGFKVQHRCRNYGCVNPEHLFIARQLVCAGISRASESKRRIGKLKRENASTYVSWAQMRARCLDPNHKNYAIYGGAGIGVCERWASFESFFEDIGPRPPGDTSLDRIKHDRGYEPGNCRWATRVTQNRNQKNKRWFLFNGAPMLMGELAEALGLKVRTVSRRFALGWSVSETFGTGSVSELSAAEIARVDMTEALRLGRTG